MKVLTSSLLILIILVQSWGKTAILIHFYSNRQEIAQEQCVNKIRKVTMCYGSCVLKEKMDKTETKKFPSLPGVMGIKEITLFYEIGKELTCPVRTEKTIPYQPAESQTLKGVQRGILRPPLV